MRSAFIGIAIGLGILVLVVILIIPSRSDSVRTSDTINYTVIEVDGMPCIKWNSLDKGGLTCNWDKWEEEKIE